MENTSWLKEAVDHIQQTALPLIREVDGKTFAVMTDGVMEIRPTADYPKPLSLHSLDALVKMVKTEALNMYSCPIFVTIPTHLSVLCFTMPDKDGYFNRPVIYQVEATDVPGWGDKVQMGFEEMQIALRTRFQETPDMEYVMRLLSEITTGAKITYNDNGVATTIVTQKGVALQGKDTIRPIVTLKPYRTFQEVEQPESTFLIRISERGISFTEADGGMWKLRARETVKSFLQERFAEDDRVIVAL